MTHGCAATVNGDRFEGRFVNDQREGRGAFIFVSKGQRYDGEWVNDCPKCGELSTISVISQPMPAVRLLHTVTACDLSDLLSPPFACTARAARPRSGTGARGGGHGTRTRRAPGIDSWTRRRRTGHCRVGTVITTRLCTDNIGASAITDPPLLICPPIT